MGTSPTVRRRRLGAELRKLREAAGLTHLQVAEHLDCSQGKISHIEQGRVPVRTSDVRLLGQLYGANEERLRTLMELAKESKQRGWWQAYADALQPGSVAYVGLESEARLVTTFHTSLVPALLQTEDYAREVLTATQLDATPGLVERQVEVLKIRQQRITDEENPLRYRAFLDESIIQRPVGGSPVVIEQLGHLVRFGALPNVTIQVTPISAGLHPLLGSRVFLVEFADPADPKTVYLEHALGGLYTEKADEVQWYGKAFEELATVSLSPQSSLDHIANAIE